MLLTCDSIIERCMALRSVVRQSRSISVGRREVADRLSFAYPVDSDQQITRWIAGCRRDAGGSGSANR